MYSKHVQENCEDKIGQTEFFSRSTDLLRPTPRKLSNSTPTPHIQKHCTTRGRGSS